MKQLKKGAQPLAGWTMQWSVGRKAEFLRLSSPTSTQRNPYHALSLEASRKDSLNEHR